MPLFCCLRVAIRADSANKRIFSHQRPQIGVETKQKIDVLEKQITRLRFIKTCQLPLLKLTYRRQLLSPFVPHLAHRFNPNNKLAAIPLTTM